MGEGVSWLLGCDYRNSTPSKSKNLRVYGVDTVDQAQGSPTTRRPATKRVANWHALHVAANDRHESAQKVQDANQAAASSLYGQNQIIGFIATNLPHLG